MQPRMKVLLASIFSGICIYLGYPQLSTITETLVNTLIPSAAAAETPPKYSSPVEALRPSCKHFSLHRHRIVMCDSEHNCLVCHRTILV